MVNTFTKTDRQIEIMKKSGKICAQALKKVLEHVKPGMTCAALDKIAQQEIKKRGAVSSFKTVEDYRWTICTTVNEQVVHGIPTQRVLNDGDILGIDIGAFYQGFHGDLAISVPVGQVSEATKKFLDVGVKTLRKAIEKAKAGNTIGDISSPLQNSI